MGGEGKGELEDGGDRDVNQHPWLYGVMGRRERREREDEDWGGKWKDGKKAEKRQKSKERETWQKEDEAA